MKSSALDAESMKNRAPLGDRIRLFLRRFATLVGLVLLIVMFAALKPSIFVSVQNIRNILVAVAVGGVVACGQMVVFSLNDFDMSMGSNASMTAIIIGVMMTKHGIPWPVGILMGLVIGAFAGAFNGAMVSYVNLNPFIATMGTLTAYQGVAYVFNNGATVFDTPHGFNAIGQDSIGPVPYLIIILVVVCIIAYFVMERTTLGRRWYAAGGNYDASYLAGIRVRRLRFFAFVVSGVASALGGLMLMSRLGAAEPTMGSALTLNAVAAVFLGMTAFKEGVPNPAGTVVGVLFLGVLLNGLNLNHVNSYLQQVVTGMVIVGSVALAGLMKKQRG